MTVNPGWITGRAQASAYTGLSKRKLSELMATNQIPYRRLGYKLVMYHIPSLNCALMDITTPGNGIASSDGLCPSTAMTGVIGKRGAK